MHVSLRISPHMSRNLSYNSMGKPDESAARFGNKPPVDLIPYPSLLLSKRTVAQQHLNNLNTQFRTRMKPGVIDVWWLHDDGGLTLLLSFLLAHNHSYLQAGQYIYLGLSLS